MSLSLSRAIPDPGYRFWAYLTAKKFEAQQMKIVDNVTYKEYHKEHYKEGDWKWHCEQLSRS